MPDANVFKLEIPINTELTKCKPKKKFLSPKTFYHFDGKKINIVMACKPEHKEK